MSQTTRRGFLKTTGLAAILAASNLSGAKSSKKPNVIFFSVDDCNDWINALGFKQAVTPNIDRLAKRGLLFTDAHVVGVYCAPSRTALMTGQASWNTGMYADEIYMYDYPEMISFPECFKNNGYKVYGGGKLFHHREGCVDLDAFDYYYIWNKAYRKTGFRYQVWGSGSPVPANIPRTESGKKTWSKNDYAQIDNKDEDRMADTKTVSFGVDFLKEEHEKPFLLALGTWAPHNPLYVPKKYFDLYDLEKIKRPELPEDDMDDLPRRIRNIVLNRKKKRTDVVMKTGEYKNFLQAYLASISYADAQLGRVIDALDKSKYKDNTIVVFWSDHGYHFGEKGYWGKHTLWERTTHIPHVWAGPGIPANAKHNFPVSALDIFPTLVDVCGLKNKQELDGKSMKEIFKDPKKDFDRIAITASHKGNGFSIVNKEWRYMRHPHGEEELYDRKTDRTEWKNLAKDPKYDKIKQEMNKLLPEKPAPFATKKKSLKLVFEGEKFKWVKKNKR